MLGSRWLWSFYFAMGIGLSAQATLEAANGEVIRVNGFVDVGVSVADRNVIYDHNITSTPNYRRFTNFGLNLRSEVNQQLTVNVQLLARGEPQRDLKGGQESPYYVKADRIYVSYSVTDELILYFGRQRVPAWLLSDYINIGTSFPWVTPPREVYQLVPFENFSGPLLEFRRQFDGYEITANVLAFEDKPTGSNQGLVVGKSGVYGGSLQVAHDFVTARLFYADSFFRIPGALNDIKVKFAATGLNIDYGAWHIWGEYARFIQDGETQIELSADNASAGQATIIKSKIFDANAYYVTGSYKFGAWLPHLTFASARIGDAVIKLSDSQSSVLVGLNYQWTDSTVFKLDLQHIRVEDGKFGLFTLKDGQTSANLDGTKIMSAGLSTLF